jgi:hypothetical protein
MCARFITRRDIRASPPRGVAMVTAPLIWGPPKQARARHANQPLRIAKQTSNTSFKR